MEYVYIILSWVFQTIRYIIIGEPLAFRIKVLTYTIRAIPNLNFSSREKKKNLLYLCIFFPLSQKKLTRFSDLNEWMTNVHALWKKKGTFGFRLVYILFFNLYHSHLFACCDENGDEAFLLFFKFFLADRILFFFS